MLAQLRANLTRVQAVIADAVEQYAEDEARPCRQALRGALVTPREHMSASQRELIELLSA